MDITRRRSPSSSDAIGPPPQGVPVKNRASLKGMRTSGGRRSHSGSRGPEKLQIVKPLEGAALLFLLAIVVNGYQHEINTLM